MGNGQFDYGENFMYNVLRDFGCIGYVCGFIVVLVCYFLGGD
jgi:hypothetical protein